MRKRHLLHSASSRKAGSLIPLLAAVLTFTAAFAGAASPAPDDEVVIATSQLTADELEELRDLAAGLSAGLIPEFEDFRFAMEYETSGALDFLLHEASPAGGACNGGRSPFYFELFGRTMKTGHGSTCVTTVWPEYKDLDPVEDFSDKALIKSWRAWKRKAAGGDAAAAARISLVRKIALGILISHFGVPCVAHLRDTMRPIEFVDPEVRALEDRTWLVEFSVPKTPLYDVMRNLGIPDPDPTFEDVKLRGWYIKGDGVGAHRPLLVYVSGLGASLKNLAYFFKPWVAAGFDALVVDKRGHGWSTGYVEVMPGDIFSMLDQLEKGVRCYGPGDDLDDRPIKRKDLLGAPLSPAGAPKYTAKSKPVVLIGNSLGGCIVTDVMAMNYCDFQIEAEFDAEGNYIKVEHSAQGYNFVAVIEECCWGGSLKYVTEPFMDLTSGFWLDEMHTNGLISSNVNRSMDAWPAYFGIKPTLDYVPPQAAVDTYNDRLRGNKRLLFFEGDHDCARRNPYFPLYCKELITWIRDELPAPTSSLDNQARTRLKEELRKMPENSEDDPLIIEAGKWHKRLLKGFYK